jgi:hypothetical protein
VAHGRSTATGSPPPASYGGSTTLLLTFHPTLRDPRIRAAVAIAPVACAFGDASIEPRAPRSC